MSDIFFPSQAFEPDYLPKVGLTPFEVSSQITHSGTQIFNVLDTVDMSEEDILKKLSSLDPRILQDMPEEVLKEIKAGNVTHIFQTDPTGSQKYMELSEDAQKALQGKGSIYLRTKEGKTARFKLPEISDADAGWNANKGGSIFMDQTIYSTPENVRSLSAAEALRKSVSTGQRAAETVDEKILNSSIVNEVLSGSKTVTGAGTGVTSTQAASALPTATKKPDPVLKIGKPVQSDTTTAAQVTQSSSATTQKAQTPTAKVQARVSSTVTTETASSGAPVKQTPKLKSMADNTSAAVARGTKNAGNLKMLGVASLLGLGAVAYGSARKTQQDNIDRRLQMQRQGIIK